MKRIFPWLVLLTCVLFILFQMMKLSIPLDPGDGLAHYYIANYALENPIMYLDHWGKPFFTLLASPFSIVGIEGIIVLNILLFIFTSWIGFKCLRLLNVSILLQGLLPIALLYSYDYTSNILSGLTEVLAGFVLVLSGFFLLRKQWIWMALCISILPFCRSEGQLIVLLGATVLLYNKQYKALPFLAAGFLIYSIIGLCVLNDFLWYFRHDPYPKTSIYGNGGWNHFWELKRQYMGSFGLLMTIIGGISVVYLIVRKKISHLRIDFLFFGSFAFFGILLSHAYLWRYGLKGSLGLTRVITIGLPIFLIVLCYLIQQLNFQSKAIKRLYIAVVPFLCFLFNHTLLKVVKNTGLDQSVIDAADFIREEKDNKSTVYYLHPLVAYEMGANPMQPDTTTHLKRLYNIETNLSNINYGDFIIRDSHFGPREMGLPLSVIDSMKEFVLVNEIIPSQPGESYHGEKWNVRIYQKIPGELRQEVIQKQKKIDLDQTSFSIQPQQEFVDIFQQKITDQATQIEIELKTTDDGVYLNYDINNAERWSSLPLKKDVSSKIKFPIYQNEFIKLYFWNPDKKSSNIEIIGIHFNYPSFHPVTKFEE